MGHPLSSDNKCLAFRYWTSRLELWTLFRHPYQIRGDDDLRFQGVMVMRFLRVIAYHAGLGPHEFGATFTALTVDDDVSRTASVLLCKTGQQGGKRLL